MKKLIALLLVFIVACGPSEAEIQAQIDEAVENALNEANKIDDTTTTTVIETTTTTVIETTTTTVPPAPISEVDFVELFNTKLGSNCVMMPKISTQLRTLFKEVQIILMI